MEKQINCLICLGPLYDEDEDIWPLSRCQHCFHRSCLNSHLVSLINNKKFPIRCPMENCNMEIIADDITENLNPDEVEKYWAFSLANFVDMHADDMSWCPTPNCRFAFVYDKNYNRLDCPNCNKIYCLTCRVEYHNNMTCKEYQINSKFSDDDKKFVEFVRGKKYKQCSQCKFWVEKNEGCDHMTCRCSYQFCYVCGGKYGECECIKRQNQPQPRPRPRPLIEPRPFNPKPPSRPFKKIGFK